MRPTARPTRGLLTCLVLVAAAAPASAGTLVVSVQQSGGEPIGEAVVMVHSASTPLAAAPPIEAVMDQLKLAFVPSVLAVPVGSQVRFPNSDTVSHQVYSFSPAKKFNLPLYRGQPPGPVTFEQPGVVTLGCNIHDSMLAYIVVTDAPYFGTTAGSGEWMLENLPAGDYDISVWHARLRDPVKPLKRRVTVGSGGARQELIVRSDLPLRPAPQVARREGWDNY